MSSKPHYNPKSKKWIISLVIMVIISIAVIGASIAVKSNAAPSASAASSETVDAGQDAYTEDEGDIFADIDEEG